MHATHLSPSNTGVSFGQSMHFATKMSYTWLVGQNLHYRATKSKYFG